MSLRRIAGTVLIIFYILVGLYLVYSNHRDEGPGLGIIENTTTSSTAEIGRRGYRVCEPYVIDKATSEINEIRAEYGLPGVRYINTSIALHKVLDMLHNGYFGHCNLNGVPSSYNYTMMGGVFYPEENLGVTYAYQGSLSGDPLNYTLSHIWAMVYNDSSSSWGHRDSLLDPTNNYVDIACAYNDKQFYLAIYMFKVWVEWVEPPSYDNKTGMFHASGYVTLENSSLNAITVYSLKVKDVVSWPRRDGVTFTCPTLSVGKLEAIVSPYTAPGVKTIMPETYIVSGSFFNVTFHVPVKGDSYTTIIFWVNNTLGIKHPFDTERYNESIPILSYSIPP